MKPVILCIGLAADETFVHTLAALKSRGIAFDVIEVAQLAYSGHIDVQQEDVLLSAVRTHEKVHILRSYDAAYIRLIDISEAAPTEDLSRRFAGLYRALGTLFAAAPLPTLNPPFRDNSNFTKLFHSVRLAGLTGWNVPRSCLTSNPDRVKEFVSSCGTGVIFKGCSGVKTWATLYSPVRHVRRLRLLASCPVLFQERIKGPDVRVHSIGNRSFGEVIESQQVDYRMGRSNSYRPISLPIHIANGCSVLTQHTGVPFLGIDFKVDEVTGEWFFLEANSLPCYQGYDRRAAFAISAALVDWLTGTRDRGVSFAQGVASSQVPIRNLVS